MKFVNPTNGTEYEIETEQNTVGLGSHLLDASAPNGDIQHLLRVEVYPLPCNHALIEEMLRRMNFAALSVMQEFGAGFDPDSAVVSEAPGIATLPVSGTKH